MPSMKVSEIPLRARKRAATRIRLVEALMERLAERPLEEIQVAELAEAAEVSQATFFNYFPQKADVLTHFIQLWSLKVAVECRRVRAQHEGALAAIEALFVSTAEQTSAQPKVMLETIAHQARMPPELELEPVELAERLLFLGDEEDVETLPDRGLGQLLPSLLSEAIELGELPPSADVQVLTLAAASVFFGVPLVMGARAPASIAPLYRQQLALIWSGARASAASSPSPSEASAPDSP